MGEIFPRTTGSWHYVKQGQEVVLIPDVEVLPHFLPPVPHDGLVLPDAQLLAVYQARALRPGLVLVIRVLLQVLLAEAGLLFIVWLFLEVGHRFPARSCGDKGVRDASVQCF